MTDKSMRLAAIAALLLAGILAGTQLGKIAPLVADYGLLSSTAGASGALEMPAT